jgi:hypothetical protein
MCLEGGLDMVDHLREVIAKLEKLPAEQQEQAAEQLRAWIADQHWDAWLKSDEGNQFLDKLLVEYKQEQQQETIREEGW